MTARSEQLCQASDRELLELAAKAAGYAWTRLVGWRPDLPRDDASHWNPLTDDGDAFRLAVKLKLDVDHDQSEACVYGPGVAVEMERGTEPLAATRRAITRAAANIGRSLSRATGASES